MIFNFSLIFLSFSRISYSPIIAINPKYIPVTSQFQHIRIKNLINNFFYLNSQSKEISNGNIISFKDSFFKNLLNSAIYLTSTYDIIDTSTIFTEQQTVQGNNDSLTLENCCFDECSSTTDHPEGGAIRCYVEWCHVNLTSCLFSKCTATGWGGAISSQGQTFTITSSIFSGCKSDDSGMAIFYNYKKRVTSQYFTLTMNQVGFINNKGKYAVNDLDVAIIKCDFLNFTRNNNLERNSPQSTTQYCSVFPLLAPNWHEHFQFVNLVENNGDFLLDFNEKPGGQISFVNIVRNFNLNYFFYFESIYNSPLQGDPFIIIDNFAFFENRPNQDANVILITNQISEIQFKLQNCLFD